MEAGRRERLRELVQKSVVQGKVTLASGKTSDFYVDGRLVTLSPEGSTLIGEAILEVYRELGATAIAGPVTGACPMVSAAGVLAHQQGLSPRLIYVRAAPKEHGMQKTLEGAELTEADRVLMVEDVITSGGSLLKAAERVRVETGAAVVATVCIVDRQAGGREAIEAAGIPLRALFSRADLSQ